MKLFLTFPALVIATAGIALPAFAHGHGGPGFFEHFDQNKDGKITLDEARTAAKARFTAMDQNKDRVVTLPEAKAHKKDRIDSHGPSEERLKARFDREDANKNGKLERSETRMPAAWFDKADTNGDAALTKQELKTAWEKWRGSKGYQRAQGRHDAMFEKFFQRMDQNADGKLTESEAVAASDAMFSRLDKDGDQSVTREEAVKAKAGHEKRGHRRHHEDGSGKGHARGGPPHGKGASSGQPTPKK